MIEWSGVARFWRRQSDSTRLCAVTATAALAAAGGGALINTWLPQTIATGTVLFGGLFYAVVALGGISWRPPRPSPRVMSIHREPRPTPPACLVETTGRSWENN